MTINDTLSPVSINTQQLVALRRDARHLKLAKGKIRAKQTGNHLSKLRGRGMEFDEVRAYQPGDDVRSIDWRVTARTNEPHTKLYTEEKERPVMLCLDYRRNMRFATRGMFKSVAASRIAALLAWAASLNGDRVGGLLFNDAERASLKAQRGKHAVLNLFHRMSEVHEHDHGASQDDTLANQLSYLRHLCRPGSLVFIASDFQPLSGSSEKHLIELSRHCEVVLIHLYDPIEAELPSAGLYRFKDQHSDVQVNTRNKKQREQHQQRFVEHKTALQHLARKHRMHFVSCTTADDPLEQLRVQMEVANV